MTHIPTLPTHAFHPLPNGTPSLPGSPRDLRLYVDCNMPTQFGPGNPRQAEMAWRILVALKMHGEWSAIAGAALLATIIVEQRERLDGQYQRMSAFRNADTRPDEAAIIFIEAINGLAKDGWIGVEKDGETVLIWPTILMVEQTQLPAGYPAERALQS